MKIIDYDFSKNNNDTDFTGGEKTAVAIGKFDGVHKGHRKILDKILSKKKDGLLSVIITFDPSPAEFLGFGDKKVLLGRDEKTEILEKAGVDILIRIRFNEAAADTEPEIFVKDFLVSTLNMKYIAAGDDLSFGKKGLGNFDTLLTFAGEAGYEAEVVEKVKDGDVTISSSVIRTLIEDGNVKKAGEYLGSPYSYKGTVAHGRHLGHTIGVPTINVIPDEKKVFPKYGVYYSAVTIGEKEYFGITNAGVKPTVGSDRPLLETYIYDFDEDIYGANVTVSLLDFEREEKHFESIDELKDALAEDIRKGKNYQKTMQI